MTKKRITIFAGLDTEELLMKYQAWIARERGVSPDRITHEMVVLSLFDNAIETKHGPATLANVRR